MVMSRAASRLLLTLAPPASRLSPLESSAATPGVTLYQPDAPCDSPFSLSPI